MKSIYRVNKIHVPSSLNSARLLSIISFSGGGAKFPRTQNGRVAMRTLIKINRFARFPNSCLCGGRLPFN